MISIFLRRLVRPIHDVLVGTARARFGWGSGDISSRLLHFGLQGSITGTILSRILRNRKV